jgi:hypothetical protein
MKPGKPILRQVTLRVITHYLKIQLANNRRHYDRLRHAFKSDDIRRPAKCIEAQMLGQLNGWEWYQITVHQSYEAMDWMFGAKFDVRTMLMREAYRRMGK